MHRLARLSEGFAKQRAAVAGNGGEKQGRGLERNSDDWHRQGNAKRSIGIEEYS